MTTTQLDLDRVEVPTKLGMRVPVLSAPWPLDWSLRQVYALLIASLVAMGLIASATSWVEWAEAGLWLVGGLVFVVLDYAFASPSLEVRLIRRLRYCLLLLAAFPAWRPRRTGSSWLPRGAGSGPRLIPGALARRVHANVTVDDAGTLHVPGMIEPLRAIIDLEPQSNPELLPMGDREAIMQRRLQVLRSIQHDFSIGVRVRPADAESLAAAAGDAGIWVRQVFARRLVERRPQVVVPARSEAQLRARTGAVLGRLNANGFRAQRLGPQACQQLLDDVWGHGLVLGLDRTCVRLGGKARLYRTWIVRELPRLIGMGWLAPLTGGEVLADVVLHVKVRRPGPAARSLQRKARQWRAVAQGEDSDYGVAVSDAERTLDSVRRNVDSLVEVGLYVTAPAEQAALVEDALETTLVEFRPADYAQDLGRRSTLPIGVDDLRERMPLDLRSVAATDVFATAGYWPAGATLLGEALGAPEAIGLNLFDADNENWSAFCSGIQGGGKSLSVMTLAWRMATAPVSHWLHDAGFQFISIDHKRSGDYRPLLDRLDAIGQPARYQSWADGPIPDLDGHVGFNLAGVPPEQRADRLRELSTRLWERISARPSQQPLMLVMDEVALLAMRPEGCEMLGEFGRQARSAGVAAVFCSQQIEDVLDVSQAAPWKAEAAAAFKNAGTILLLRQNDAGITAMKRHIHLDQRAVAILQTAEHGGLLRIERQDGPRLLALHIRPSDEELGLFGTNPHERLARDAGYRLAVR